MVRGDQRWLSLLRVGAISGTWSVWNLDGVEEEEIRGSTAGCVCGWQNVLGMVGPMRYKTSAESIG